jgi:PEP-CTERM motif
MKIRDLLIGAAAVAFSSLGLGMSANAGTTVIVEATQPFGSWLDTGLNLSAGKTYEFTVNDPSTIWSAGNDIPFPRTSTADGIPSSVGYGQLTMDGSTFNFGALVGDVSGHLFLIGTGPTPETGLSGELTVGYWDGAGEYGDNSGAQSLTIAAIPEPAAWAMTLLGVGMIGATLRSRRKDGMARARA